MLSGKTGDNSQHQHPRDEDDEDDGRSPKRLRNGPGIADSGYNNDVGSGISHGGLGKVKHERRDVGPAVPRTQQNQDKSRRLSCKECRRSVWTLFQNLTEVNVTGWFLRLKLKVCVFVGSYYLTG